MAETASIIVFDKYEALKAVLSNRSPGACPFWDDRHYEQLDGILKYEFSCANNHKASTQLELNGYVAIKDYDGEFVLFQIKKIRRNHEMIQVEAVNAVADDLHDSVIRPATLNANTAEQAVAFVLQNSRWDVGVVEWLGIKDFVFDSYPSALEALLEVKEQYGGELRFRIALKGNRIVGRYIDLLVERGRRTGKRFEYGKDIVDIERTQSDEKHVVTALIGLGPSLSGEQGRMTFANVEAPDKPLGDDFIADDEALEKWGKNGKHRMGVFEYGDAETAQELLIKTREELEKRKEPQITYDLSVILLETLTGYEHERVRLGDTVAVLDKTFDPPIAVSARVIEIVRSYTRPENDEVKLGNFKPIEARITLKDLNDRIKANDSLWKQQVDAYTKTETDEKVDPLIDFTEGIKPYPGATTITGDAIETRSVSAYKIWGGILSLGEAGGGEVHVYDVNDDGELENIGEIIKEGAYFPKVRAGELIAPNKLEAMSIDENEYPTIHYYVDNDFGDDENDGLSTSTPKRTVQAVLNSLPRYLSAYIIIEMVATGDDQEEDLEFKGFVGDGTIVIKSSSGYKRLSGLISVRHCSVQIIFTECALKCPEATDIHVKIETCQKVEFEGVKLLGENRAQDGIRAYYSQVLTRNCELYRYTNAALVSARGNMLGVENCSGSENKYGVYAYGGGIVTGGGTAPTGTTSQTKESYGNIIATFTNNSGTTPTEPVSTTSTKTRYFDAADAGAWRENYGGQWSKSVPYQGKYNSWGRYRGYWFHGSQLGFLQGKTIKSMKIKVKRDNAGGNGGDVSCVFRTHNYTSQPSGDPTYSSGSVTSKFAWGTEKWVDVTSLKSAFINGTAKGFAIYTTSTSNSGYAIFKGTCQVKVTYEE